LFPKITIFGKVTVTDLDLGRYAGCGRGHRTAQGIVSGKASLGNVIDARAHRDRTMILIAYRHGLRISEPVALRREQVDLGEGFLYVNRMKHGTASTHPVRGPELRALRRLRRCASLLVMNRIH